MKWLLWNENTLTSDIILKALCPYCPSIPASNSLIMAGADCFSRNDAKVIQGASQSAFFCTLRKHA